MSTSDRNLQADSPSTPPPVDWTLIAKICLQLEHTSVLVCTPDNSRPTQSDTLSIDIITPKDALLHQRSESFVVVYNCLDALEIEDAGMLLGRLKNLISPNILVISPRDSKWQLTEFIAMGFKGIESPPLKSNQLCGYYYDLNTYNHKRTWNNSRFWANPENFNKFRW